MNYSVRWKDCHKSDAVENYLQEKMSKFFDFNFVQDNLKAEIVFYPKTKEYTVRINISVPINTYVFLVFFYTIQIKIIYSIYNNYS